MILSAADCVATYFWRRGKKEGEGEEEEEGAHKHPFCLEQMPNPSWLGGTGGCGGLGRRIPGRSTPAPLSPAHAKNERRGGRKKRNVDQFRIPDFQQKGRRPSWHVPANPTLLSFSWYGGHQRPVGLLSRIFAPIAFISIPLLLRRKRCVCRGKLGSSNTAAQSLATFTNKHRSS